MEPNIRTSRAPTKENRPPQSNPLKIPKISSDLKGLSVLQMLSEHQPGPMKRKLEEKTNITHAVHKKAKTNETERPLEAIILNESIAYTHILVVEKRE